MIGMGDRTFCSSPNCQNKCGRKLTDDLILLYTKQWGNENFPVAMSPFCGRDIGQEILDGLEEIARDQTNNKSKGSDRV